MDKSLRSALQFAGPVTMHHGIYSMIMISTTPYVSGVAGSTKPLFSDIVLYIMLLVCYNIPDLMWNVHTCGFFPLKDRPCVHAEA